MTSVTTEGDTEKEDQVIVREDFWISTSMTSAPTSTSR